MYKQKDINLLNYYLLFGHFIHMQIQIHYVELQNLNLLILHVVSLMECGTAF